MRSRVGTARKRVSAHQRTTGRALRAASTARPKLGAKCATRLSAYDQLGQPRGALDASSRPRCSSSRPIPHADRLAMHQAITVTIRATSAETELLVKDG